MENKSLQPLELKNLKDNPHFFFFWKKESPLSQFHYIKNGFIVNHIFYTSTEQYMMHQKALLFNDEEIAEEILKESSPNKIKKLGRKVKRFEKNTWNKHKCQIVYKGNYEKFIQNPTYKEYLLNTAPLELVEASPFDNIWGIKMGVNHPDVMNPLAWQGENLLGRILTTLRNDLLKTEHTNQHSQ